MRTASVGGALVIIGGAEDEADGMDILHEFVRLAGARARHGSS